MRELNEIEHRQTENEAGLQTGRFQFLVPLSTTVAAAPHPPSWYLYDLIIHCPSFQSRSSLRASVSTSSLTCIERISSLIFGVELIVLEDYPCCALTRTWWSCSKVQGREAGRTRFPVLRPKPCKYSSILPELQRSGMGVGFRKSQTQTP